MLLRLVALSLDRSVGRALRLVDGDVDVARKIALSLDRSVGSTRVDGRDEWRGW